MKKSFIYAATALSLSLSLWVACSSQPPTEKTAMPVKDTPYQQARSVKYELAPNVNGATFKKVVVDHDYSVYILTDKGVYRDFENHLIGKDRLYASIAEKVPVDITTQEETGYLYYLYPEQYLTNAHAGRYHAPVTPNTYERIAVNALDQVLLAGKGTTRVVKNGSYEKKEIPFPEPTVPQLYTHHTNFYALTPGNIYLLEGDAWKAIRREAGITAMAFVGDEIAVGTTDGVFSMDKTGKTLREKDSKLPVPSITAMIQTADNKLWFSTADGAYFFDREMGQYRYFEGNRWLNENTIISTAADRDGNIYLLTPTGLNQVKWETMTLAQKADLIEKRLRKWHLRYGYSTVARLADPNDPTSLWLTDTDNDGLWGAFYLGAMAFKYAATGDAEAQRYAWESFEAFERCRELCELQGFPPRTFERHGYEVSDLERWRHSKVDPDWDWKGHTSSDEYCAYLLVTAVMDECVARTPEEKKRVADYFLPIMQHIVDNNYAFVDVDGQPTLWGRYNPEYVNGFFSTQFDRRLNSGHVIAGLQMAYKLSGNELFKNECFRVMKEWGYWDNLKVPMKNIVYTTGYQHEGITMGEDYNHSDDEMAFFAYWPLERYALNDTMRAHYKWLIADHWEIERPEKYASWNLLSYATAGVLDLDGTLWHLRTFGLDNHNHAVRNSHRRDIKVQPFDPHNNFRDQRSDILLTPDEKPLYRHNGNAFIVDGGRDGSIYSGDEYLFPYWLARYLKVIE